MATLDPVVRRFARSLKRTRLAVGLSQGALAAKVKVSRPFIVQLEAAQREPSIVTVVKLARALGVSVAKLLG